MNAHSHKPAVYDESTDRRTWFAFGLWLRAGMLGILMLAGAVALWQDPAASLKPFVALLMAGSALVLLSWRGARAAFARMDDSGSVEAPDAPPATAITTSGARIRQVATALE